MIEIIDLLKPKNGGNFKLIEDIDIAVDGYSSLADCVAHMATTAMIEAINAVLSGKQDKLTTAQLTAVNSGITSELVAQITANTTAIAGKADAADLTALEAEVDTKASITTTTGLQAQIDNLVTPTTQDAEVQNARVDAEGQSYATLKARIDSTETKTNADLTDIEATLAADDIVQFAPLVSYLGKYSIDSSGTVAANNNYFAYIYDISKLSVATVYRAPIMGYFSNKPKAGSVTSDGSRRTSITTATNVTVDSGKKFLLIASETDVIQRVENRYKNNKIKNDLTNVQDYVDSLVIESINKFNKNSTDIIAGSMINGSGIQTGQSTTLRLSHLIEVKKNTTYKFNIDATYGSNAKYMVYYATLGSESYTLVSGTVDGNFVTYTAAENGFIRFNQAEAIANTQMFCESASYPVSYTAYSKSLNTDISVSVATENLIGDITKDQADFISHIKSENIFDKSDIVTGYYLNVNGNPAASQSNFYTYIPIEAGNYSMLVDSSTFGQTNALKLPLFDASKQYVYTLENGTSPTSTNSHTQEAHFTISQAIIDTYHVKYIGYSEYNSVIDQLMVVKDSTYPSTYIPYRDEFVLDGVNVDVSEDKYIVPNALYHKKAVFDGDSICAGTSEGTGGKRGWAYRIGTANAMDYHNVGESGGTITAEQYDGGGNPRHWLSRYIDTIHTNYPTLDYLILEGGTNDADVLRGTLPTSLGTLDMSDFSGVYDDTNFTGALDQLFFKATSYYPNAKIGFIIAQKMGVVSEGRTYTQEDNNRRMFFERAMDVCNKWGIPYINLWDGCPLNPSLAAYYNTEVTTNNSYTDGQHLTAKGYDIITPKIEAWIRTL